MERSARGPRPKSLTERLWAKVNIGTEFECWPWRGQTEAFGYGVIRVRHGVNDHGTALAHRVAYAVSRGLPEVPGLCVLHRCDNPPCCNPDHLFLGTRADNVSDMIAKGRMAIGPARHNYRVTPEMLAEIRRSTERGVDLSKRLGISQQHISHIRHGSKRANG